jgi:hypothetical protein
MNRRPDVVGNALKQHDPCCKPRKREKAIRSNLEGLGYGR